MLLLRPINLLEDVEPVCRCVGECRWRCTFDFRRWPSAGGFTMARRIGSLSRGLRIGRWDYANLRAMYTGIGEVACRFFGIALFLCCWCCPGELALRRHAAPHITNLLLIDFLGGAWRIFVGACGSARYRDL